MSSPFFYPNAISVSPLCGPTFGDQLADILSLFVSKTNPEVFGPLNMHDNKIINLSYGTSLYDAAALGQVSGGSVPLSSIGVVSHPITTRRSMDGFRSSGPVLIPPTSRPLYTALPANNDVINILPGAFSTDILPTLWTRNDSNVESLSGYTIGSYSWDTFPLSSRKVKCTFTTTLSGTTGLVQAYLCVFSMSSQTVLTGTLSPMVNGLNNMSLELSISFASLEIVNDIGIALRFFIPSSSSINVDTFELTGIYFL